MHDTKRHFLLLQLLQVLLPSINAAVVIQSVTSVCLCVCLSLSVHVCVCVCTVLTLTFENLDLEFHFYCACTSSQYLSQVPISRLLGQGQDYRSQNGI